MQGKRLLAALAAAAALAGAGQAAAESQVLRQRAELKGEKFTDAATVAVVEPNGKVDVVRREGGWILVRAGGREGWLRAEALGAGTAAQGLLALDSGRSGRSDLIATTGIRGHSKPASQQVHALIMAISAYERPNDLKGVSHDIDTAREIALRMGVAETNMRVLRDQELTLDGMRRAFDDLDARVLDNDQVFIYYSGHGGRQLVLDRGDGAERCAESLISIDGKPFIDTEIEARMKRLAARTQKVVMFIDACHSGGVTTRAVGGEAPFKAKSWNGKGSGTESCAKPTNVLTRGIALAAKSPGSGGANFAYIAAARDNEISLDQPNRGGVATQAWRACMAGAARDIDGSGGLSVEEIRACAQERIDAQLRNATGYLPHHVTVTGNPSLVLSYAAKDTEGESPATPAPTAAAPAKPSPLAALNDIYNNRDDRRLVTLKSDKPALRIGQDKLDLSVTSREAGYLYLLMVGSDGEAFDLLFPNQIDRNNLIQAGETVRLPRAGWQLTVQGPAGRDTLLAIVTDAPRDFGKAGLKPAGPFSMVGAVAAKDIQLVTATSAQAERDECSGDRTTRNIGVQKSCSNAYGAALLSIDEVAR